MKILRATSLGMCFGVRDAIDLARSQTQPLTILGDLVHNETVLEQLRSQGVRMTRQVADVSTASVMITAHGASNSIRETLRQRGLHVLEATCPLVHYAHQALQRLVREGYHPLVIGKPDHVEVRALTGDLKSFDVVLEEGDVARIQVRSRFGVVAQTTQPLDKVLRLVALVRERFFQAEVRFVDTVCQPTKQRQIAAQDLARRCDVVIVIGGAQSNNTRQLALTCARSCDRVHHVQTAADLRPEWLESAGTVGLTAGTSTPNSVIDAVETELLRLSRLNSAAWDCDPPPRSVTGRGNRKHPEPAAAGWSGP
jgi:4-hydroxy-3-methylbut-2-en-1-yl diphosphate reductase